MGYSVVRLLFIYLLLYLFTYLLIYLFACLLIYLFIYSYLFFIFLRSGRRLITNKAHNMLPIGLCEWKITNVETGQKISAGGGEEMLGCLEIILANMGGSPNIFNDNGWATKHTNKMCA